MAKSNYPTLARLGMIMPPQRLRAMSGAYESGSATGSRSRSWNPSGAGPNSAVSSGLSTIRRRARNAVRNDPWAKTAVARWVSNVVGTGIQPYSRHPDPKVRASLKDIWADWAPESDADERMDFYGQQALAARGMFVDGEALARFRPRRPSDGLVAPLQIQAFEGDHLPVEETRLIPGRNQIISGVEFNGIGQREAYHLWSQHPGEYGRSTPMELRRVPAAQIIHAYAVLRPGQIRGVSELATVLLRLKTLDSFDDAVAFRQELSNLFAGFVTRKSSESPDNDPVVGEAAGVDTDGALLASMEPGTMSYLLEDEDVTFASPPGAPDNYSEFTRQQLMAAFASVGIPYEIATGDIRGISDRTLRVVVNEFHRLIEQFLWGTFIHQFCRPVWNAVLDALALAGVLPADDYLVNRRLYRRVLWVPQGWEYFNPVQDVKAKNEEIRAGLTSRTSVILAQGEDPEAVFAEIQADNRAADAAGMRFDSDPRYGNSASAGPVEPDDDPADPGTQPRKR